MSTLNHRLWILLAAFSVSIFVVGCRPEGGSTIPDEARQTATREATATTLPAITRTSEGIATSADYDLDLQEANVLEVEFEALDDGRYRFDVTLLHDDDGEAPLYADRWEVWDTAGNMLGERVLTHSHGTQPFTRSATIEIPEGVTTVLVRAHDMQHGHGGQSMEVDLISGQTMEYEDRED
jgi:hypothetical protein